MFYQFRRALQIVGANPAKLLRILSTEGWRNFFSLRNERKSPERIAAYHARKQMQQSAFQTEAWKHEGAVSQRQYGTYDEYVAHQKAKLDDLGGEAFINPDKATGMFRRRFELVSGLSDGAKVLCLGARRGEEVRALRELGCDAIGIDLNPGKDNPYVVPGDFHALDYKDGALDAVYVNCLDHAFDLKKIVGEVHRVLRKDGRFIVDIVRGYDEGYTVGNRDAMHWPLAEGFARHLADIGGFKFHQFRDLAEHGSPDWTQAILVR